MTPAELADLGDGWRTCSGCGTVEDAAGPDQDGEGRSACCSPADRCAWCGYQLNGYADGCDTCGACIEAGRGCACGLPADPDRCYHGVCHGPCCTDDPHPCGYCLDEAATP